MFLAYHMNQGPKISFMTISGDFSLKALGAAFFIIQLLSGTLQSIFQRCKGAVFPWQVVVNFWHFPLYHPCSNVQPVLVCARRRRFVLEDRVTYHSVRTRQFTGSTFVFCSQDCVLRTSIIQLENTTAESTSLLLVL